MYNVALLDLRYQALRLGANAVIAVSGAFAPPVQPSDTDLCLSLMGTAVYIEALREEGAGGGAPPVASRLVGGIGGQIVLKRIGERAFRDQGTQPAQVLVPGAQAGMVAAEERQPVAAIAAAAPGVAGTEDARPDVLVVDHDLVNVTIAADELEGQSRKHDCKYHQFKNPARYYNLFS
jgi:hypothetical protein